MVCQNTAHSFKGWKNPGVTAHFEKLNQAYNTVHSEDKKNRYQMWQQIGKEMDSKSVAFSLCGWPGDEVRILDLCMAPGGFSTVVLKKNFNAKIRGITLSDDCGGLEMLIDMNSWDPGQVQCQFLDITMLATEFGVFVIPESHPEQSSFITSRPYHGESFQIVFCGGSMLSSLVLPKHRDKLEYHRLRTAQLILALQRIERGGTLVMLLHKVDAWDTTQLLYQFYQFSTIQLFKPQRHQDIRQSFYLVAKNVEPDHQAARAALSEWKEEWWQTTFGGPEGSGQTDADKDAATVQGVINEFGRQLIELAEPVWRVQCDGFIRLSRV